MQRVSADFAFEKLKPERCVFVISVDKKGNPNGMIAGWQTKCSASPPMFAVALANDCNTQKLIRQSKEFVIAVPNKKLEKQVLFFGSHHGNKIDKFKQTGIKTAIARFVKSPLLKDATINFECKLAKQLAVGDCVVFIGRILASYYSNGKKVLLNMKKSKNGKRVFREF